MMTTINSLIDVSALNDGTTVEAAAVLDPINDLIEVLNDEMSGDFARDGIKFSEMTELTIASGEITVTQRLHSVDTESDAATDDLDTINGLDEGEIVTLVVNSVGRVATLKHGTGNIGLPGGRDIALNGYERPITLVMLGGLIVPTNGWSDAYAPADEDDWLSQPTNFITALDQLAARLVGRGWISGLEITVSGDATLSVAEGEALDATHSKIMRATVNALSTAVSGAGGIDTGSVAADTWYYVWMCAGGSGTAFVLSTSATSPTLPTGYTNFKRRIGMVRTDASSNLHRQYMAPGGGCLRHVFYQEDCTTSPFQVATAINAATAPSFTTVACSAVIPPTAAMGKFSARCNAFTSGGDILWRRNSSGGSKLLLRGNASNQVGGYVGDLDVSATQTIDVAGTNQDEDLDVMVNGYVDNLLPDLVS